jgi:hypothetical protein
MRVRDAARQRRSSVLATLVVALVALSGCTPPGDASFGLTAVANERAALAEARVATLLDSYGEYLESRWPGIVLPETRIEAWLGASVWTAAFERCATQASGLTVRVDPTAGVFATPAPQTAGQLRDFETSIYQCQGRLPPPNLAVSEPGPVEVAWLTDYVRDALPTCLRREGITAEPAPDDASPILLTGETPEWDPYAAVRGNVPELRRMQALCPPATVLLNSIPPLGAAS